MILSAQLMFSDKQAITVTAVSTNIIDRGPTRAPYGAKAPFHDDLGYGNKVPMLVQVVDNIIGSDVTFKVVTGDTETLGTTVVEQTVVEADLVAGRQFVMDCLPNQLSRYFAIEYEVAGTATAGAVTAGVSMGNQTNVTGA
jgi:hypothetical protein